jgi:hypothetical protein
MSKVTTRISEFSTRCRGLGTLALSLLCFGSFATAAPADVTKFYNQAHSLMGSCTPDGKDKVPDPGCPEVDLPPGGPFVRPMSVTTDSYGNIYLASERELAPKTYEIDIYDPAGHYIGGFTETKIGEGREQWIAVDSEGHLYVYASDGGLVRFDPTVYSPETGEIEYGSPPVQVINVPRAPEFTVDLSNDHLYVVGTEFIPEPSPGKSIPLIEEYGPPVDGEPNELLASEIGKGTFTEELGHEVGDLALDRNRDRLYVIASQPGDVDKPVVMAFSTEAPYEHLATFDGSNTPNGSFDTNDFSVGRLTLAADETSGHIFVGSMKHKRVYELESDGDYVGLITAPGFPDSSTKTIAVDNSEESPNKGYLYVPAGQTVGHLFAYEPAIETQPPAVKEISFDGVTEDEAVLQAMVNPKAEAAHWTVEFTTEESFESEGWASAEVAGEGDLTPGDRWLEVFAPATGLQPGTTYRFRVRAENECEPGGCSVVEAGSFTTFKADKHGGTCANQSLRTGASANLPDCRAYELVTPADTGGLPPDNPAEQGGGFVFATPPASPAGDSFAFSIANGIIPGFEGGIGGFYGDTYVSRRGADGWGTELIGPDGSQAGYMNPGGLSADHRYFNFGVKRGGSLVVDEVGSEYVRYPDGSFRLVGEGSLATDRKAGVLFIGAEGHVIFRSEKALVPGAAGGGAIYDRTSDGALHVVSLLPGDVTPEGGADFQGASADGSAVAFRVGGGSPLYLRLDNSETVIAAPAGAQFAGLTEDGSHLFYMQGGDLYRFDSETEEIAQITESGDVEPVNIGSQGTGGYFLSPSVLPVFANPLGAEPQPGAYNLYHWQEGGALDFVAIVTERDAEGVPDGSGRIVDGLGRWLEMSAKRGSQALISSRTSADGSTLLFESRADLTGFEADGKVEIFRYDSAAARLQCVSCDETGMAPEGDAELTSLANYETEVPNLSANGKRAFFETPERLVSADNDSRVDVYQWETQGEGTCLEPDGCLSLISGGQSGRDDVLFGVSRAGDDVFIGTADQLTEQDTSEAISVYDVRVGGGFAPPAPPAGECLGESCQPAAQAPEDPTPASSTFRGSGDVKEPRGRPRCGKGKRRVRRAGKARCVRKKKAASSKKRAGANRRAHR